MHYSLLPIHFFLVFLRPIMNRLQYWIKAQTQYGVHSPFVFDMYRKVLFARVGKDLRRQLGITHDAPYHEMVYKLRDHYRLEVLCYDDDEAVLQGDPHQFGTIKVVCRPHSCKARELRWQAQQGNSKYRVSIDLYDVGLLLDNPKLHRQHFLLR